MQLFTGSAPTNAHLARFATSGNRFFLLRRGAAFSTRRANLRWGSVVLSCATAPYGSVLWYRLRLRLRLHEFVAASVCLDS